MRSILLLVAVVLVSGGPDTGVLYPGYVVNYNVKKGSGVTLDANYAFLPLTRIYPWDDVTLVLGSYVTPQTAASPSSKVRWNQYTPPTGSETPILTGASSSFSVNVSSDAFYYLSVESTCSGAACGSVIETEIEAVTYSYGDNSHYWPPFQLIDQRRTCKFSLAPTTWIYFWLLVTDNLLTNILKMNLYVGAQFYQGGSQSGVVVVIYDDALTWPNATVNVTSVGNPLGYYPQLPNQKGDWVMSTPVSLDPGLYQVCFFNPIAGNVAHFTSKSGFNKPPTQAANLNASWNPLGFFALVLMCITAILKH